MIPVETPLGTLETGIGIGGEILPVETRVPEPAAPMSFHDDAVLSVCLAEPYDPPIAADMTILGCYRVRWTLVARRDTEPVAIYWTWRQGWSWEHGGADMGQYFDAMTYASDTHVATIATRDGAWLADAAKEGEHIPRRFTPKQESEFYMLPWVKYRQEGLVVEVPPLKARERATVFLALAWAERQDGEEAGQQATMLAADLALLW